MLQSSSAVAMRLCYATVQSFVVKKIDLNECGSSSRFLECTTKRLGDGLKQNVGNNLAMGLSIFCFVLFKSFLKFANAGA